ncbi:hypothetical protein SLE2022_002220 [Rubroshorea leprosula]
MHKKGGNMKGRKIRGFDGGKHNLVLLCTRKQSLLPWKLFKIVRERLRKNQLVEAESMFIPNQAKQVAGESLNHNGIVNCNNCLKNKAREDAFRDVWDFAKELGVVAIGDHTVVLEKLQDMESKDRLKHNDLEKGNGVQQ